MALTTAQAFVRAKRWPTHLLTHTLGFLHKCDRTPFLGTPIGMDELHWWAEDDNVEMLEWARSQNACLTPRVFHKAAFHGSLRVLRWHLAGPTRYTGSTEQVVVTAGAGACLASAILLGEYSFDDRFVHVAIATCNLDTLKFIHERWHGFDMERAQDFIACAIRLNQIPALDWLASKAGFYHLRTAVDDYACAEGDMIKHLCRNYRDLLRYQYIEQVFARMVREENLSGAQALLDEGLAVSPHDVNVILYSGHITPLVFLLQTNCTTPSEAFDFATTHGNFAQLEHLVKKLGYKPTERQVELLGLRYLRMPYENASTAQFITELYSLYQDQEPSSKKHKSS